MADGVRNTLSQDFEMNLFELADQKSRDDAAVDFAINRLVNIAIEDIMEEDGMEFADLSGFRLAPELYNEYGLPDFVDTDGEASYDEDESLEKQDYATRIFIPQGVGYSADDNLMRIVAVDSSNEHQEGKHEDYGHVECEDDIMPTTIPKLPIDTSSNNGIKSNEIFQTIPGVQTASAKISSSMARTILQITPFAGAHEAFSEVATVVLTRLDWDAATSSRAGTMRRRLANIRRRRKARRPGHIIYGQKLHEL